MTIDGPIPKTHYNKFIRHLRKTLPIKGIPIKVTLVPEAFIPFKIGNKIVKAEATFGVVRNKTYVKVAVGCPDKTFKDICNDLAHELFHCYQYHIEKKSFASAFDPKLEIPAMQFANEIVTAYFGEDK